MASATIVGQPYVRGGRVYVHAAVDEGGQVGVVEYVASVPYDEGFQALGGAQKKAALQAALKAVRDGQLAAVQPIAGVGGTVTL